MLSIVNISCTQREENRSLTSLLFIIINRVMTIKRCPYCKAIIDDSAEYCSNCGTKLLFPEDEFIEEDIPGEKILNDEVEPEKPESDESETSLEEIELPTAVESVLESEDVNEQPPDLSEDDDKVVLDEPEEIEEPEEPSGEESGEIPDKPEDSPKGIEDSVYHMDINEKGELHIEKEETASKPLPETPPERADIQTESQEFVTMEELKEPEPEADQETETKPEEEDDSYRNGDQMSIFDPVEKEKKDIEQFLDTLKKERGKEIPAPADTETGFPPWAKEISQDKAEEDEVSLDVETEIEPDGIEEEPLEEEKEPSFQEERFPLVEDKESTEDLGLIPDHQSGLLRWIKSRLFDLLLVSGVWFLAVWLASRMLGLSAFRLISSSTEWVLILLGIFLFKYFFLFFFFLGRTLGDHLFPRKD